MNSIASSEKTETPTSTVLSNSSVTTSSTAQDDEIVIDLAKIVRLFVHNWRVILIYGLLFGAIGGALGHGYTLLYPSNYEAVATVAIVKTRIEIEFDPKFKTVNQDELPSAIQTSADSRRASLVGLVQNGQIAQNVAKTLSSKLDTGDQNPAALLRRVRAEAANRSDLISIKVQDTNAERAAEIANAWAIEYERYTNAIYGGAPSNLSSTIKSEYQRALQEYQNAQQAYEQFLKTSKHDEYSRIISETQQTLDLLQRSRQDALLATLESEQKWRQSVLNAYREAQATNRVIAFLNEQEDKRVVIREQSSAQHRLLGSYYNARQHAIEMMQKSNAMRQQLIAGGDAAASSNYVALISLKAQVYSTTLPIFQVSNLPQASANAQITDLDALIGVLNSQIAQYDRSIVALSQQLAVSNATLTQSTAILPPNIISNTYLSLFDLGSVARLSSGVPTSNALSTASSQQAQALAQLQNSFVFENSSSDETTRNMVATMRDAHAKLEQEQAMKSQLIQARDIARDTFNSLSRKQAELSVASAVSNTEVRFAAPAVTPLNRVSTQSSYPLIGIVIGVIIGILFVFILRPKQFSLIQI